MTESTTATILLAVGNQLPDILRLVFVVAAIVGTAVVISGVNRYMNDGRTGSNGEFLNGTTRIVFGSCIVGLSGWGTLVSMSLLGSDAHPLIYEDFQPHMESTLDLFLQVLVGLFTLFGWLALFRGLWLFSQGTDQQDPNWVSKGMWMTIAGSILANFAVAADIGAASVGADPVSSLFVYQ